MKPITIKIAILTLVCIGQIQLVSAYVTGLIPWHIFFAFLLCGFGLLTVIVTAVIDSIKKSRLTIKWTLPIFTSLTLGFILGWVLSDFQDKQRKENAEELIAALNEYKADKGKYPESQMELKPEYLSDIPRSNWGLLPVMFSYEADSTKKEFALEYKVTTGCGYYYHSSMKEWQFWD